MDTTQKLIDLDSEIKERIKGRQRSAIATAEVMGECETVLVIDSHILELQEIQKKLQKIVSYTVYIENPHQK